MSRSGDGTLAAGGGSVGFPGVSPPPRRGVRAGSRRSAGLVPRDRRESCQQAEVLPALPEHLLSIEKQLHG